MYSPGELLSITTKSPIVLLSRIIEYNLKERRLIAEVDISSECIFFDPEIGGVWGCIGLEYIAQAAGCLAGVTAIETRKRHREKQSIGLIGKSRNLEIFIQNFFENHTYRVSVKEEFSAYKMSYCSGKVLDEEQRLCAKGDVKMYCRDMADLSGG